MRRGGAPTEDAGLARMLEASGSYKGFGLGMMVEILCGLLAGGPVSREILPMFTAPLSERRRIAHFFVVLDVERFLPRADFAARLRSLADEIRSQSSRDGEPPVVIPGDPEKRFFAVRSAEGIPAEEPTASELLGLGPAFREALR